MFFVVSSSTHRVVHPLIAIFFRFFLSALSIASGFFGTFTVNTPFFSVTSSFPGSEIEFSGILNCL